MKKSTNRNSAGDKGDNKEYGDADGRRHRRQADRSRNPQCCHCRRSFHPSIIVDHEKHCSVWQCRHCCAKMLQTEKEDHKKHCNVWRCRHHCGARMRLIEKDAHVKACGPPRRQECKGCRKLFPRGEIEAHRKDCKMWCCRRCGKIMPSEHRTIISSYETQIFCYAGQCPNRYPSRSRPHRDANALNATRRFPSSGSTGRSANTSSATAVRHYGQWQSKTVISSHVLKPCRVSAMAATVTCQLARSRNIKRPAILGGARSAGRRELKSKLRSISRYAAVKGAAYAAG